jgi:hypothetical protein
MYHAHPRSSITPRSGIPGRTIFARLTLIFPLNVRANAVMNVGIKTIPVGLYRHATTSVESEKTKGR